jgi:hypothetical protein
MTESPDLIFRVAEAGRQSDWGYLRVAVVGFFAWLIKEGISRWHSERQHILRKALEERLEKVYTPLYYLVGEYIRLKRQGSDSSIQCEGEIREILKTLGHHLKPAHFIFCADLIAGRGPSDIEVYWHRTSFNMERERLRYILYKDIRAFEALVVGGPMNFMSYWTVRAIEHIGAALVWVAIFAGLVFGLKIAGAGEYRALVTVAAVLAAVVLTRALVSWSSYKARFDVAKVATLRTGSRGPSVERLQGMLLLAGMNLTYSEVDGVFGRRTEEAVKVFQKEMGQKTTGRADPRTLRMLYKFIEDKGPKP